MKRIVLIMTMASLLLTACTLYEASSEAFILDNVTVYKTSGNKPDILTGVKSVTVSPDFIIIDALGGIEHDYRKDYIDSVVHDNKIIWKK